MGLLLPESGDRGEAGGVGHATGRIAGGYQYGLIRERAAEFIRAIRTAGTSLRFVRFIRRGQMLYEPSNENNKPQPAQELFHSGFGESTFSSNESNESA